MITTVLFDLDGTLLPMNQEEFLQAYMSSLVKKMVPFGYDPEKLLKSIWTGTGAMVKNNGNQSNEEVFWQTFSMAYGRDCRCDEDLFLGFYKDEFQKVKEHCGYNPCSAKIIRYLKSKNITCILATNPLFPPAATISRIKWAGLMPEDFSLITTYDNSRFSKPNTAYYKDILERLNIRPQECLMVGNDVDEDMIAKCLGIHVFLLTDCLINKHDHDISVFPQGGFDELMSYLKEVCE